MSYYVYSADNPYIGQILGFRVDGRDVAPDKINYKSLENRRQVLGYLLNGPLPPTQKMTNWVNMDESSKSSIQIITNYTTDTSTCPW
jgi:hypothetical protein